MINSSTQSSNRNPSLSSVDFVIEFVTFLLRLNPPHNSNSLPKSGTQSQFAEPTRTFGGYCINLLLVVVVVAVVVVVDPT